MADNKGPVCSTCRIEACNQGPGAKTPPGFCPMLTEPQLLSEVEQVVVEDGQLRRMAVESARTEAAGYCRSTRVEEIMDFARRMGWTHLGIAHCIGLMKEAEVARRIFTDGGFQVSTVCCKTVP
jgi:uncharacterized metal-binding protein